MSVTGQTIVTDAFQEIGVAGATLEVSAEDLVFGLSKLNRLFDGWTADGQAIYANKLATYTLTPSLNPHTLGPTGATWTVSIRPDALIAAHLITSGVRMPIRLHDAAWWASVTVPAQTSANPCDGYYAPSWPNGQLYLAPVPSAAYSVELLTRVTLAQLALTDTFTLPPGYRDAITLTLAESLCGPLRVEIPQLLPRDAQKARARVFDANTPTPALATADFGLGARGSTWDFTTGTYR